MSGHSKSKMLAMEALVGLFVILILIGLGVFTIILSREAFFGERFILTANFETVLGLRDGDNVVVKGMPVGKVTHLDLREDGVHVTMSLEKQVAFREGYDVQIRPTSILGGRQVEIDPGPTSSDAIAPDEVLAGRAPFDLFTEGEDLFRSLREAIDDGGIVNNVRQSAENLREITDRLAAGEGMLGRLLSDDDDLYKDLAAAVGSIREVTDRLESGEGTLGKLLSPEDTLYDDINSAVKRLSSVVTRVEKGEGTLGKMLDPEDTLYGDMTAAVQSLRVVAERLEEGEGTVGKLLADDALYTEIEGLVGEARATMDDFRENIPITTFSSIFFGAF